ncbi:stage V sporulation protein K [Thermoclostridium stercorarium subsp. stercorarium DSM 8532]|jgi:SpoVK/Ycf46/Vps4 family AAA+-type ATPase|uniref:Stage V sporulation protein K n=2 Tax=Thermoclostridium stercorarium TaxID=1510 RepID=L7VNM7_THES1|nr:AAA family ATPase [Thermoclostridium stercorarium]AGC68274.1 stage V sporulation protein K [Thermoclostridium stercorarium subsp. stercorarium DSM 8532]AGI39302.1 ATPase [Thermoclostridium stercorarium subsp. stercorarium DSM 8532]ANW98634.1 stage V sporulation protein K [Thermoclostridium stercorarium subsp. thermolacticum DSM 2910]UZQ86787.1 AAA family ATPase [Thermoclostridium stercorarium]
MDNKNRFLSSVYYDLYHRKPSRISENNATDSNSVSGNSPEQELKSIIDDFYRKEGFEKSENNETTPFKPEEIRAEIEKLVGLTNVKEDIEALMDFVKVQKLRREHGLSGSSISLHTAFLGNPGTGKTTVARLMGEYFKALGVLKKGHIVEVTRADLVAEYVGGTAVKTNKVIDKAIDGILFIDEAYSLAEGGENDFGKEAINILVDRMEKERDRLAVFLAGYTDRMEAFLKSNPGLSSRVSRKFYFKDYTGPELLQIFEMLLEKNQYTMDGECLRKMEQYFNYLYETRDEHFGNGRAVRNTLEKLIKAQSDRLAEEKDVTVEMLKTITMEDIEKALRVKEITVTSDKLESILQELDEFVGLKNIKGHIKTLVNLIRTNQKREELGLPVKPMSYHAIFCGSPGTGKTSIARILGRIYQSLGILKKGHVIEVDRSGLVAGYVGQTEEKTNKVLDQAMDGILFIDEAYALVGGPNDFGRHAIDTILKRMDDCRDRLVVIAAGYTDRMKTFINSNPGLKDRFSWVFEFEDYNAEELFEIFLSFARKQQYVLDEEAEKQLKKHFEALTDIKPEHFGNGRYVRNLFEKIVIEQSNRIGQKIDSMKKEDLSTITAEDVSNALLLM